MATPPTGRVALMSIRPEFAGQIVAGSKRVEFRKRRLADDVTHVVIYSTAPVGLVVGAFTVGEQTTAPPEALWSSFAEVGGISHEAFSAYYADRDSGTGIGVVEVYVADSDVTLEQLGVARAPQSFQYLSHIAACTALGTMSPVCLAPIASHRCPTCNGSQGSRIDSITEALGGSVKHASNHSRVLALV